MTGLRRCCDRCRESRTGRFCWRCTLLTAGFPIEHALWEKAPGFRWVAHALGLV